MKTETRARPGKTLVEFVREHRHLIDGTASAVCRRRVYLDDEERGDWVNNDEDLYNQARAWGWDGND